MSPHLRNLLPGLKSLVWPQKNLLFAGIGSILGFSADFASFLTNFASPVVLLGVALVMTTGLALLCTPKIFRADLENAAEVDAVSKCLECDLLRLFAVYLFRARSSVNRRAGADGDGAARPPAGGD